MLSQFQIIPGMFCWWASVMIRKVKSTSVSSKNTLSKINEFSWHRFFAGLQCNLAKKRWRCRHQMQHCVHAWVETGRLTERRNHRLQVPLSSDMFWISAPELHFGGTATVIRNAVARVKRYESLIKIRNQGGTAEFSSLVRGVFLFHRNFVSMK